MRPFKVLPPGASLIDMAQALSHGSRIVGISGGSEGSAGLSKVVSQGLLFKSVASHLDSVDASVRSIMTTTPLGVLSSASAFEVFEILTSRGISGLAVVNEAGTLEFNTSSSDLKRWTRMQKDQAMEHLAELRETSIADFLRTLRNAEDAVTINDTVAECTPDDTIA